MAIFAFLALSHGQLWHYKPLIYPENLLLISVIVLISYHSYSNS